MCSYFLIGLILATYMLFDIKLLERKIDKGDSNTKERRRMSEMNKILEQGRMTYPIYFLIMTTFGVFYLIILHVELLIGIIRKVNKSN